MSFVVNWTFESERTFNDNISYLIEKWDTAVLNDFFNEVDNTIAHISNNPYLFPAYKTSETIRKCVLTKQITVYYKIVDDRTIDLLTFWNSYQNPKKLKL